MRKVWKPRFVGWFVSPIWPLRASPFGEESAIWCKKIISTVTGLPSFRSQSLTRFDVRTNPPTPILPHPSGGTSFPTSLTGVLNKEDNRSATFWRLNMAEARPVIIGSRPFGNKSSLKFKGRSLSKAHSFTINGYFVKITFIFEFA